MKRTPMRSSLLHSVRYDRATSTLNVVFRNGETYEYFMVPSTVYQNLMSARSKGQFFLLNVSGKFPFKRTSR